MAVNLGNPGAQDRFCIVKGKCDAASRRKRRFSADGLAAYTRPEVEGQVLVYRPVVLDELGHFRIRCLQLTCALKVDLFGHRAILRQEVDGMRNVRAAVTAVENVASESHFVTAQPGLWRELISRQGFQLIGIAVPPVEVISTPPFRRNLHIRRSLPVGVAVEPRIPNQRVEYRA